MRTRLHRLLLKVYRRVPPPLRLFVVHRMAPSFTVGALCVVEREDGAVLLVRHSYRQRWGLPGGLLQRGESVVDGVHREAREEIGLPIQLVSEPTVVVAPRPRRVDVVYRARLAPGADPGAVRASSPEIVEIGWFDPEELPELQHEAAGALVTLARATGRATMRPAS